MLDLSLRTVERWEQENGYHDQRQLVKRVPANQLTQEQLNMVITTANNATYRDLLPCKIVPLLADAGTYIASESTFYRILRAEKQLTHRLSSRPSKYKRPEAYEAQGSNRELFAYTGRRIVRIFVYDY